MRLLSLFIALFFLPAAAAVAGEGEYQVKAAMLFNFAKFVEWPVDAFGADSRIMFCIAGKSPLSSQIQQVQGKQVKGRTVSVRPVSRPEDVSGCQMLFISHSENAHLSAWLQQAGHQSILTVSDLEQFASSGGMIGFYEEESRIRFEINAENAQKRRLQISSQLLNLARRVR